MKRTALTLTVLILLLVSTLAAQDTAANDEYITAMTNNDPAQRVQLLKAWLNKYGGSGHQYENFANATVCTEQYQGKSAAEITKYGEAALKIGGLDNSTKGKVLMMVAAAYVSTGQNLSQARNYAGQLSQLAKTAKGQAAESGNAQLWDQMTLASYAIQGQAYEKENNLKGAVEAYSTAYNLSKNKQLATSLAQLGKSSYEAKDYATAEKAFKIAVPALNDFGSTTLYAKTLHRSGKKTEAVKYYKESYNKRKTGEVAYNLGILLAPNGNSNATVANEAIEYLLAASFLSPANSERAMKLAEGLYFNQNPAYNKIVTDIQAKTKSLEQMTNTFNSKFADKAEDDLTDAEKKEVETLQANIEKAQKDLTALQTQQQTELEKFQARIAQTKQKLGIQ
jgi:tetratricopeptide (TPR) repeat protein